MYFVILDANNRLLIVPVIIKPWKYLYAKILAYELLWIVMNVKQGTSRHR